MVLHRSVVHSWAVVAANSVVLYDVDVPSGALAVGSPALIKEGRARPDAISGGVASYVERARLYPTALRRIG
jgi:acetyltransferase-like isoleucine patch superfamily enzyme